MAALGADLEHRFEERVIAHLEANLPEFCEELSQDELEATVHRCVERAKAWEILAEGDICKYAILGLLLGADFDTERPWAQAILKQLPKKTVDQCLEELKKGALAAIGEPDDEDE
jgi:hypothetical protein